LVGLPGPFKSNGQNFFLKWRGSFRVTNTADNYIFEVESIFDQKKTWVHGDRMRFYADDQLNITEEIKSNLLMIMKIPSIPVGRKRVGL
jgi:hypothetical protein